MLRRVPARLFPIYALVFVAGVVQTALTPLGPVFAEQLHLSRIQVGALFAVSGVSILVIALPVGVFSDRLGSRGITVAAASLMGVSALGQGLADSYWLLLASRALSGVAFGAVWTAGLAFLAETGSVERRSARLGATIPVAGVAASVGPAFAGILTAQFGVAVPFVVIAAVAGLVAVALSLDRTHPALSERAVRPPFREVFRVAGSSRLVLGSIAIMVSAGLSSSVAFLLVPLQLKANGVSIRAIGVLFAVAALLYIATSLCVTRLGARAATLRAVGVATLVLGAALVLPAASTWTSALAAFVLLRALCNATMSTVAYPLASAGGEQAGIGAGTALGLTNAGWATATVIGPLAGGAIAQAAGNQVAFGALLPLVLVSAAWLLLGRESVSDGQRRLELTGSGASTRRS